MRRQVPERNPATRVHTRVHTQGRSLNTNGDRLDISAGLEQGMLGLVALKRGLGMRRIVLRVGLVKEKATLREALLQQVARPRQAALDLLGQIGAKSRGNLQEMHTTKIIQHHLAYIPKCRPI